MTRTCVIEGCESEARTRGWCGKHYARWLKHGDPQHERVQPTCSIEDCGNPAHTRGFCAFHYQRWYRHGDPLHLERVRGRICDVEGCNEPHSAKGLCQRHHAQAWRAEKRKQAPPKPPPINTQPCTVDGCETLQVARGLCPMHYHRLRKTGDTKPRGRKPEGSIVNGYRHLYRPDHPQAWTNGYVAEHRMVMADILGRPLLADENVHHRDGNKLNNDPKNLELWLSHQPKGQRVTDLLGWAREIVGRYGDIPPENLG